MKNIYYLLLFGFMSVSLFAMDDQADIFDIDDKTAIEFAVAPNVKYYEARTKSGLNLICRVARLDDGDEISSCSRGYGSECLKVISKIKQAIKKEEVDGFQIFPATITRDPKGLDSSKPEKKYNLYQANTSLGGHLLCKDYSSKEYEGKGICTLSKCFDSSAKDFQKYDFQKYYKFDEADSGEIISRLKSYGTEPFRIKVVRDEDKVHLSKTYLPSDTSDLL